MERKIGNAKITSTTITNDAHGSLSIMIHVKHKDGCQGFGGYALYFPKTYKKEGRYNITGHFIWRVLEVADVDEWDKLVGKTVRIDYDYEKIYRMGHILEDIWFDPSQEIAK